MARWLAAERVAPIVAGIAGLAWFWLELAPQRTGFEDTDGSPSNGCETDVRTFSSGGAGGANGDAGAPAAAGASSDAGAGGASDSGGAGGAPAAAGAGGA